MEKYHHLAIMTNPENKEFPIGIGFSNEQNEVEAYVALTLHEANEFGEKFCEAYNLMLQKVRGDT